MHNVVINFHGLNNFISNSAIQCGGAIYTDNNSTLTFNGTTNFTNNGGQTAYGGGLCMGLNSSFYILPNTTVYWEKNRASVGGAIYVNDAIPLSYCTSVATYVPQENCFFQLKNLFRVDVRLVFNNNYADVARSVLYGGAIDNCKLTGVHSYSSGEVFNMISLTNTDYNIASKISSDPFHICPCVNNQPACSEEVEIVGYTVHPGETFQFSVVAVGQRNGAVPSTVRNIVEKDEGISKLQDRQYLQHTNNTCTKLNYTVFSLSPHVGIELYAEGSPCPRQKSNEYKLFVLVHLTQSCPPAWVSPF